MEIKGGVSSSEKSGKLYVMVVVDVMHQVVIGTIC